MNALHVETIGSGPELVMLHGWGMHSGIWDGVRTELARSFRLHLVDLPGYGLSPLIAPYTLDALAQTIAAAFPAPVNVCGWSLGGQIALRWAQNAANQVRRLALVATTPCFTQRADWRHGVEPAVLEEFASSLEHDYPGTLRRFLSLQVKGGTSAKHTLKRLGDSLFNNGQPGADTLQAGLEILRRSDMRGAVKAISHPALVLHGEEDALADPGAALWLGNNLPNAKLVMLPACAHAPFLSHPEEFLQALTGFFHEQ